jgi:hypothetical protein
VTASTLASEPESLSIVTCTWMVAAAAETFSVVTTVPQCAT